MLNLQSINPKKTSFMKVIFVTLLFSITFFACQIAQEQKPSSVSEPVEEKTNDGIFIHIKSGIESPHEVLMALNLASIMSESKDVVLYFDIKGIEVVLKDSPDLTYKHFPSSHIQIKNLLEKGITIMACPGCLKAAEKTAEDLMEGIQEADKETFFGFTEGRILTIDY